MSPHLSFTLQMIKWIKTTIVLMVSLASHRRFEASPDGWLWKYRKTSINNVYTIFCISISKYPNDWLFEYINIQISPYLIFKYKITFHNCENTNSINSQESFLFFSHYFLLILSFLAQLNNNWYYFTSVGSFYTALVVQV